MIYGKQYLKSKLERKKSRVDLRYEYYEMKQHTVDMRGIIPDNMRWIGSVLGWCGKAVDTLADRIAYSGFKNDGLNLGTVYRNNNADVLFDSAVLSAMISSCAFVYIGQDDEGYPTLQVLDGGNATGIIDPITGMLTEGYAVLERDEYKNPLATAYFTAGRTEYYRNGEPTEVYEHKAPYALLVPIVYRPDARRPFGHSRISRACMDITQSAMRTIRRSEVAAEFYSAPQRYILGLDEESEFNGTAAMMSNFLAFSKDEDGDKPTLGQFSQQSMTPFIDQMRMLASMFAGETGLTLDDLGFTADNPSSSEAIRASHEHLRLTARKAQRTFSTGFINAGYLSACVRDKYPYKRTAVADTAVEWRPIFEPDSAALGGLGDAILKINQAVPDFLGVDEIRQLTGLEGSV